MKNQNNEFSNTSIKDRIIVLENTTHKLVFRTFLESGGGQNQIHYHSKINETFKIIKGKLIVKINEEEKTLISGNKHTILPYTNHMFYNTSKEEVIFDVEIINPNKMIKGLQIMYGLNNDDKTNSRGLPKNILHAAIGLKMLDAFSPKAPHFIQKNTIAILAFLGNVFGVEKSLLDKYC